MQRTHPSDKSSAYPWALRKLGGNPHNVLPRYGHAAFAVVSADTIVMFGGAHSKGLTEDLLYIDINTMTANNTPTSGDIPRPRVFPILAPQGNTNVLYYGGEPLAAGEPWDPHFYTLSLNTGQWTRLHTVDGHLPRERTGHSAAMAGTTLIVWGGRHGDHYLNDMFALNTSTFDTDTHWEYISANNEGPSKRSGHVSTVYDNHLYIFGGSDGVRHYNDIWSFDLQARYWTQIPAVGFIPKPRTGCSASLVGDVMYVFGGTGPDGQNLGDLCAFKMRGSRWFMFQNMGPSPSARAGQTFSVMHDKIFSIGGDAQTSGDPFVLHILDCSKIRYPPETQVSKPEPSAARSSPATSSENETAASLMQRNMQQSPDSRSQLNSTSPTGDYVSKKSGSESGNSRHRSLHPEAPQTTASQQQARHVSMVPEAALRRPRTTSPMPKTEQSFEPQTSRQTTGLPSPQTPSTVQNETVYTYSSNRSLTPTSPDKYRSGNSGSPSQKTPQRPPRSARENTKSNGASLRQNTVSMYPVAYPEPGIHSQMAYNNLRMTNTPPSASPVADESAGADSSVKEVIQSPTPTQDDLNDFIQEIKARDRVISNMKKLEPWWRNEVMIARRMKSASAPKGLDDTVEADEAMLLELGEHLSDEQLQLFEQLLALKTELRRTKAGITGTASSQAMSERISQSEMMRTASLQETAYFKSKYLALLGRHPERVLPETRRVQDLERQLTAVLAENENNRKLIATLNKNEPHEQAACESAEDRARDAQERAKQAQEAHSRTVEKLQEAQKRVARSEAHVRDNQVKIAELTHQVAHALSTGVVASELTDANATIAQLESVNNAIHSKAATLQDQLDECLDDIAHLRDALNERQQALDDATRRLETTSAQVHLVGKTMSEKGMIMAGPSPASAPTKAY